MMRAVLTAALLGVASPAAADPEVFHIAGADGDLWLLGSVHYLRESDYPLPDIVDELYAEAERVVLELDLDDIDTAEMQAALLGAAMLPEGDTLESVLAPGLYTFAERHAAQLGVELAMLGRLEPWLVALTLTDLGMRRMGYLPDRGLEQYLVAKAAADGKPVIGLETIREQVGVFDSMALETQQAVLEQTLAELESAEQTTAELIDAWRTGRFERLGAELLADFDTYPELYGALVAERNRNWIAELETLLAESGDELVVVGALHLVGPDSVIALLEAAGHEVERLGGPGTPQ